MGQEKLHGFYWLVSGGAWWTERLWVILARGAHWEIKNIPTFLFGN
jgi:hypothetical protein